MVSPEQGISFILAETGIEPLIIMFILHRLCSMHMQQSSPPAGYLMKGFMVAGLPALTHGTCRTIIDRENSI